MGKEISNILPVSYLESVQEISHIYSTRLQWRHGFVCSIELEVDVLVCNCDLN
jgi:hypothetical protein